MMRKRFRVFFRRRAAAWFARRSPRQAGPITLNRKRLYILPTRAGLYFGLLVFVMLLGSMNYSNSLGFVLTFLLAGLGLVCMHHTHRNLAGLRIRSTHQTPVFAGESARFNFVLDNPASMPRFTLQPVHGDETPPPVDVLGDDQNTIAITVAATHRGQLPAPRFKLQTRFPMGLFRAWAIIHLDCHCLVYPRPVGNQHLPEASRGPGDGKATQRHGQEEFAGLRAYQVGDSPRLIHWKAYAHSGELLVKQFAATRKRELWLDYADAQGAPEARFCQLCLWVVTAHRQGFVYGLRLPDATLAADAGGGHRDACLRALALSGNHGTQA